MASCNPAAQKVSTGTALDAPCHEALSLNRDMTWASSVTELGLEPRYLESQLSALFTSKDGI